MEERNDSLAAIFEGWDGYQTSLLHAIQPLTRAQLEWRPGEKLRSIGETAGHIALGRIDWFSRMGAPGSSALAQQANAVRDRYSNMDPALAGDSAALVDWLGRSWSMVAATLREWRVSDLSKTFAHEYWGKTYAVSYQWVIWRILTHDVQHGGEISLMLGLQGLSAPELGDLGGHLTEPPVIQE
jgi:uncharacterized damage-inducible protein DinB